ncbi:conjugal transfer protein TraF [Vibrio sp.]|nr:conjugal transfer protein TraF [Vibrio sp.]
MKIKITTLIVSLSCSLPVSAYYLGDAKTARVAGTGVATGHFVNAPINPALLSVFDKHTDQMYITLGIGATGENYRDSIDTVDDIQDSIDNFDRAINNLDQSTALSEKESIISGLSSLDEETPTGSLGARIGIYAPSHTFAMGFSVINASYVGLNFHYTESDEAILNEALATTEFNEDDLTSNLDIRGIAITELALHFATQFYTQHWRVRYGVSPKYIDLQSYAYNLNVNNADTDDWFNDQYRSSAAGVDLDIGMSADYKKNYKFGLVARNISGIEIEDAFGDKHTTQTTYTAAIGYQTEQATLAMDIDLEKDPSFNAFLLEKQWARFGLNYAFYSWLEVGTGVRLDLQDNYQTLYTIGFNISPYNTVTLDTVLMAGEKDALGAAIQLGVQW